MTSTEQSGGPTPPPATLRPTRQRKAVVEAMSSFDRLPLRAGDPRAARRSRRAGGLATVYRTLQRLADAGEVDVLRTEDGEAIYRRCSDSHHHHLVCRSCGATVEVEGPTVERWTSSIAAEHGYADVSHTLEIFGTCPRCR